MTYTFPAREFAADTCLLKAQRLQNKVLRCVATFHVARRPATFMWRSTFHMYDFITQLSTQQAKAIQTHANATVGNIGQGETIHRKYTDLNLAAVKLTTVQVTKLSL
jgi:hypothetical protein